MDTTSTEQIENSIERILDGDRDAFRLIVDRYLSSVRALIVGRSLPGIDVDDVVQRSFVEAYKNLADYKLGTNFQAWILTIARYQLMAETTRVRRVSDYHSKYVPEALARQNQRSLEVDADDGQRMQHLASCLSEVPDSGREVLRRRYEAEQTCEEIASALDRSPGAIRKQLCLLRQQLHRCISVKLANQFDCEKFSGEFGHE
ncbi:sigma-70 family RNA polymerase sigma factor [Stieleria sp. TO1_6]|uniref:RNA polymerase sigma factor n=1 Tax=Stieleria tagensis TaxID=2956795 RepID=UPI00209B37A4|nr:sigma-70 family RNA polymerase sigma factor [Stieleria tagensis]MCO8124569.1 sigma-70 family RNA polymerase sigma factor [Stieleria tagensis]